MTSSQRWSSMADYNKAVPGSSCASAWIMSLSFALWFGRSELGIVWCSLCPQYRYVFLNHNFVYFFPGVCVCVCARARARARACVYVCVCVLSLLLFLSFLFFHPYVTFVVKRNNQQNKHPTQCRYTCQLSSMTSFRGDKVLGVCFWDP